MGEARCPSVPVKWSCGSFGNLPVFSHVLGRSILLSEPSGGKGNLMVALFRSGKDSEKNISVLLIVFNHSRDSVLNMCLKEAVHVLGKSM